MYKKYIPTLEQLELIKTGFEQKIPAKKIAKQMGIDRNVLHEIYKEYNIINPRSPAVITKEMIELVKTLFNQNVTLKKMAETMNCNDKLIVKICKNNNLSFSERGLKGGTKLLPIPKEKLCKNDNGKQGCGLIKPISEFKMRTTTRDNGSTYTKPAYYCAQCEFKNSDPNSRKHYAENPEYHKAKYERSKTKSQARRAKRINEDPSLKLRDSISKAIRKALKKEDGSKNGMSIFDYLPYTFEELKAHMKSKFIGKNDWMTFDNYGSYKLGGEMKWHIDHIIPQSALLFDSMEHPNFLKCWSLDNLQPLEAVENIKKGNKILKFGENSEESLDEDDVDFEVDFEFTQV